MTYNTDDNALDASDLDSVQVLVVDDEEEVESLMKRRFRREITRGDYQFSFCHDGEEALDTLTSKRPVDLVLCDINMPRMNGLELLDRLESTDRDCKVVMITAYSDMDNIRNSMNHGAFDFIVKPLDFSDLLMTMKRALDQLHQEREMQSERDAAEAARRALSRYFPAHRLTDVLASRETFGTPHEEDAAVMFVDLAGFTRLSHLCTPIEVFTFLRDFQGRLAHSVFENGGHVDKYMGDGLMAVFSTAVDKMSPSGAALRCGRQLIQNIAAYFDNHPITSKGPLGIRIGAHFGPVLVGNIGDETRLEFATIGDTVNIAARLEALCKTIGVSFVASEDLVEQAKADGAMLEDDAAALGEPEEHEIRGITTGALRVVPISG
ncbi:MAG: response regulator [Alphaproteobacteria bacterium]